METKVVEVICFACKKPLFEGDNYASVGIPVPGHTVIRILCESCCQEVERLAKIAGIPTNVKYLSDTKRN